MWLAAVRKYCFLAEGKGTEDICKGVVGVYSHTGVVEDHAIQKVYRPYFCPFPFPHIFIKISFQRIHHTTGVAAPVKMGFL